MLLETQLDFVLKLPKILTNMPEKTKNRLKTHKKLRYSKPIFLTGNSIGSLRKSESIVMVHIMNEARSGHPISKEVLKLLKSGLHMPDHIIKLFTVQVCLSLSMLKQHQAPIIEGLKNVITKLIICNQRSNENAWFQEEVPGITDGKSVLLQLIQNVCQHGSWGLTGQGVVDLALALLDTNAGLGKPDYKTKTCWKLAQDILRQVCRFLSIIFHWTILQIDLWG